MVAHITELLKKGEPHHLISRTVELHEHKFSIDIAFSFRPFLPQGPHFRNGVRFEHVYIKAMFDGTGRSLSHSAWQAVKSYFQAEMTEHLKRNDDWKDDAGDYLKHVALCTSYDGDFAKMRLAIDATGS